MDRETIQAVGICSLFAVMVASVPFVESRHQKAVYSSVIRVETPAAQDRFVCQRKDGPLEVVYGFGSRLTDTDCDGRVDTKYHVICAPKRWPVASYLPVTNADQKIFDETISRAKVAQIK